MDIESEALFDAQEAVGSYTDMSRRSSFTVEKTAMHYYESKGKVLLGLAVKRRIKALREIRRELPILREMQEKIDKQQALLEEFITEHLNKLSAMSSEAKELLAESEWEHSDGYRYWMEDSQLHCLDRKNIEADLYDLERNDG